MTDQKLLRRILRTCRFANVSPSTFGIESINDPNLVGDMEMGRELRTATRRRVEHCISRLQKRVPRVRAVQ